MDIDGHKRSDNFEDRGVGGGGGGRAGGGLPVQLISTAIRFLGVKGTVVAGAIAGAAYMFLPSGVRQALVGQALGGTAAPAGEAGKACAVTPHHTQACDFSRAVLASTEDVWNKKFQAQALPEYGTAVGPYQEPTLVVFSQAVSTGGCGNATSAVGPFYCPADKKLYIDPTFYQTMESKLKAPGDFAQAYVIAHEVGHHLQNLMGSSRLSVRGESKNQVSVRVELQADCLAGVWGHTARASLNITEEDLSEALTAAHAIGDDSLGHADEDDYTHGSAKQRMHWFRQGFDSGDARRCDTFAVRNYAQL